MHSTEISHCGCPLPDDCWGSDGWHFRRYDAARLKTEVYQRFVKSKALLRGSALMDAWDEFWKGELMHGRIERGVHFSVKTYLGLPVAYEPCPAYRSAYASALSSTRASQRATELLA